jgi:hypothetical protein
VGITEAVAEVVKETELLLEIELMVTIAVLRQEQPLETLD